MTQLNLPGISAKKIRLQKDNNKITVNTRHRPGKRHTGAYKTRENKTGELRIIAGQWRGKKLRFPAQSPIRPTPDRVRETLFNWLSPIITGAHCLDLFAGSGILGIEALSRGAATVTLVDRDTHIVKQIQSHLQQLGNLSAEVIKADALEYLTLGYQNRPKNPFDIVFLDPPYDAGLLPECCQQLEAQGWLAQDAAVYIELAKSDGDPPVPRNWKISRKKKAGQVGYYLAMRYAE